MHAAQPFDVGERPVCRDCTARPASRTRSETARGAFTPLGFWGRQVASVKSGLDYSPGGRA
jgi:hypothetical protein